MKEKKTPVGQQPIRDARSLGVPKMLRSASRLC